MRSPGPIEGAAIREKLRAIGRADDPEHEAILARALPDWPGLVAEALRVRSFEGDAARAGAAAVLAML